MKYSLLFQIRFQRLVMALGLIFYTGLFMQACLANPNENSKKQDLIVHESYLSDVIPSDSIYAFGYEPKWQAQAASSNDWQILYEAWQSIENQAQKLAHTWTEEEQDTWNELTQVPFPKSVKDLAQMGLSQSSAFWFYGLGLIPSLVIEVPNPTLLRQWSQTHLSHRQHGFNEVAHPHYPYWRKELKRWVLLVRLNEHRLHVALIPKRNEPVLLSYFLRNKQELSLTETLKKQFSLFPTGRGSGLIFLNHLVDMFFGSEKPLLKQSGLALGLPLPLFDSCAHDFKRLTQTLPLLTFGLREVEQSEEHRMLEVLTLWNVQPEALDNLTRLVLSQVPIKLFKAQLDQPSEQYGGLALRFSFQALIKGFEDLASHWKIKPWTCSLFSSFNQASTLIERPDWPMIKSLLSPLKGLSLFVSKTEQNLQKVEGFNFSLWAELLYPNPQLLLNVLLSLGTQMTLPSEFFQTDGVIRDLSIINPKLNQPRLSMKPHQMMLSLGSWGEKVHQFMVEQAQEEKQRLDLKSGLLHDQSGQSMITPLLWLALPSEFSSWLNERLAQFSAQGNSSPAKVKQLNQKSNDIFRTLNVNITTEGILFKVLLQFDQK